MSKLEIGTKIKIREDLKENSDRSPYVDGSMLKYRGQIAFIKSCNNDAHTYRIDLDNGFYHWADWMFEVVEDIEVIQNFTKNDLEVGMLLEFKDCDDESWYAVVMPKKEDNYGNTMYLMDDGYGNIDLEMLDDDLLSKCFPDKPYKVYSLPNATGYDLFDTINRELLFTFKRELTIKEIEELLGYEIKIVA